MRLRRLDLARYGKFTGRAIDFGERAPGRPDLHIVYGPNEAGKSTAFAAFLDLLFGIEQRSPYNFLHPYPTMRIGGALELEPEGDAQEFVRIKRPRNSLLDAGDQPIAEGVLGAALGRLLAVFESYPELKANETVAALQEELSSTENKVAFARQAYNDSVMQYNTRRESFPDNLFAGVFGFTPAELLQATQSLEQRAAPKVSFR